MKSNGVHELLDEVMKTSGEEQVRGILEGLRERQKSHVDVLTIVANSGVHQIPERYLIGDTYEASYGNLNTSTQEALIADLSATLLSLAKVLRSKQWKTVYLIPTGHAILSMNIKTMVYRILRINTIDWYYEAGNYSQIKLDQRSIILRASPK